MLLLRRVFLAGILLLPVTAVAGIFGAVRGVVHDPEHRPIQGATVVLQSKTSDWSQTAASGPAGDFEINAVPLGEYTVTIIKTGFRDVTQNIVVNSSTEPVLHFALAIAGGNETVNVSAAEVSSSGSSTPTTMVSRNDIELTPGAERTNSLQMITNYVPGAYETHDMLHMRGGHQVSWLIDGVEIPNTNIASNVGSQIDPKDIDYLEVQRGSYNADLGDRTYGVFNVVPRSGFERNNDGELILSAGNFYQTNDQINIGGHSEKGAYYVSANGNRSNLGLEPPSEQTVHDAENGYGGLVSLIYNAAPHDQLRLVSQLRRDYFQIPYDPNPASWENQLYQSAGLRDGQHESDGLIALSWVHTFNTKSLMQISPFYHYNAANYDANPADEPVATTSHRASNYAGMQASVTAEIKRNSLQAGIYGFGQHDSNLYAAIFNDTPGKAPLDETDSAIGGLVEEYISDSFKATSWLTLNAGLRNSYFTGGISENALYPRIGAALQIPKFNWVLRGFYGHFYQPPPLIAVSGALAALANANNTTFLPLHGERDEEWQFGLQIPLSGWMLDADNFQTRANNFLDHTNLGESSIYFPVTIDGALIQGWELTVRSPRLWNRAQLHLAYSNQVARQRGGITGGLGCYPVGSPQCAADFNYIPLDHDQRNTLNTGFEASLPWRLSTSASVSYGSGFTNGYPSSPSPYLGNYLPEHTTFDASLSRAFGDRTSISINALNVGNTRVLLDNSLTFGGFHWNNPREVYVELRYRFHY